MALSFDKFAQEFGSIVEADSASISPQTDLESIQQWDSVAVVAFMAFVSESSGAVVDPEKIARAKTVGDLFDLARA